MGPSAFIAAERADETRGQSSSGQCAGVVYRGTQGLPLGFRLVGQRRVSDIELGTRLVPVLGGEHAALAHLATDLLHGQLDLGGAALGSTRVRSRTT